MTTSVSRPARPLWKRLLFAGTVLLVFLALAEAALAVGPGLWLGWTRGPASLGELTLVCVGDSVTHGDGVASRESFPSQLLQRVVARGTDDLGVVSLSEPGATFGYLTENQAWLRRDAAAGRRVYLVMLGHNDFVRWPEGVENPFRDTGTRTTVGTGAAPEPWRPRLWKVFRWGMLAVDKAVPVERIDASVQARVATQLRALRAATAPHPVYVLTYVLPGEPGSDLDPWRADVIRRSRLLQAEGNEVIRREAAAAGLGLVDLERRVDAPSTWTDAWFQDNIHLTATGYARVADTLLRELALAGEIPAGLAPL